jgi:hypothetical protein
VLGRYSLPSSITLRFLLELPTLNGSLGVFRTQINFGNSNPIHTTRPRNESDARPPLSSPTVDGVNPTIEHYFSIALVFWHGILWSNVDTDLGIQRPPTNMVGTPADYQQGENDEMGHSCNKSWQGVYLGRIFCAHFLAV